MKKYERELLEKINLIIEENLDNSNFEIMDIVNEMNMSRTTLYRNLSKWVGLNPNRYIRKIRLEKAKELLTVGVYATVKETAQAVGFNRAEYFSKLFFEEFQILPSEVLRN